MCFCPNRSARRTSGGVARSCSPDGDSATGYDKCGRFDRFHQITAAIGKYLVNISMLGLQHTLSRSENSLAGRRKSRPGDGRKLILQ